MTAVRLPQSFGTLGEPRAETHVGARFAFVGRKKPTAETQTQPQPQIL